MFSFPCLHTRPEKSSYLHHVNDELLTAVVKAEYREVRPDVFVRNTLNNPLVDRV
jgi:hypothetical protein